MEAAAFGCPAMAKSSRARQHIRPIKIQSPLRRHPGGIGFSLALEGKKQRPSPLRDNCETIKPTSAANAPASIHPPAGSA